MRLSRIGEAHDLVYAFITDILRVLWRTTRRERERNHFPISQGAWEIGHVRLLTYFRPRSSSSDQKRVSKRIR